MTSPVRLTSGNGVSPPSGYGRWPAAAASFRGSGCSPQAVRQFFQMDAACDQHGIDTGGIDPSDIGTEAVADGGDPLTVTESQQVEAAPVDRSMRLAMIPDRSAQLLVAPRQHTGADRHLCADHHDKVGIGADHRQRPGRASLQDRIVVGDSLVEIIDPGIHHESRFGRVIDHLQPGTLENILVAGRPDMQAPLPKRRMPVVGRIDQGSSTSSDAIR